MLNFWGTAKLFSMVEMLFNILPEVYIHWKFSTSLPIYVIFVSIFHYSHVVNMKWYIMVLICISLMTNNIENVEYLFLHACWSFGETFIQVLCSFLNCVVILLLHYEVVYNLDINLLSDIWLANFLCYLCFAMKISSHFFL